jgi:Carboxypeptidase regulatory-like domain
MKAFRIMLGALLLAVSVVSLGAQSLNTSQISGTVEDASGAAIPNATVILKRTDTGFTRKVVTNAVGQYVAPDLPLGPYTIEVTAQGFRSYRAQGIVLQVGTNPEISPKLQPGEVTQQVTVEAIAPGQVETESNAVGEVIDQTQVVQLPLNGRDPTQLIALAGATTPAPAGDLNSNKNYPTVTLAVAGGLPNGISYVLDGGSYNDVFNNLNLPIPFPDALQEFKVETSDLPAQYGDHSSAAINAITKSGGNQFHGDLFEFVRNYMFNSRNFFQKTRDSLKRNQYGGVIGGPIKHDKLFFFAGFQGTIIRSNPNGNQAFVPTQNMMNGDFTEAIGAGCYGSTTLKLGGGFSGNKIDPSTYNQQALNAIKAGIPVVTDPSNPCGTFDYPLSQNSTAQQIIGRVDWTVNPKQNLYARYFIGRFNSPVTLQPGDLLSANEVAQLNQDQSATIGHTYIFSPNVINSVRLTGNRTLGLRTLQPFFDPATLGINDYVTQAVKGFMGLSITNGFSIGQGGNNPGYFNSTVYQIADDVNIIRGSHQITFGGNYLYAYMNTVNNRPTNGGFSFNGTIVGGGKVGYADFLTGNMSSFFQGNPDYENDVYDYVGIYGQDSWKATRHLTVNYGVRWEPYIPFWNRNSHAEHFDPTAFSNGVVSSIYTLAPAGMSFPGDPGFHGRSYNGGKLADFAPRIGLIFVPDQQNHWSIRAGYGVFYDSPQMFFDTRYSNSPPWGQTVSLNGKLNFTNPWATYEGGQDPFPGLTHVTPTTPFVQQGTYVNSPWNFSPMSMEQWDLSVQHQMKNWLVSVSYLGNRTLHLPTAYEGNPAVYIPGNSTGQAGSCGAMNPVPAAGQPCSTLTNTTARRSLTLESPTSGPYYQTIAQLDPEGNANYHGMLAAVQHQGRNLTLSANYTYAHCLSEAATTELTGPTYNIIGDRHASYSNCDSDRRQLVNGTMVYTTPHLQSHMKDLALGGWGVSTIFTARAGGRFSVFTGIDNSYTGINATSQVAIKTGSPYAARTNFGAANYVTKTAFTSPATGTFTTAPPLTIVGPASYELDMALLRDFHVTERQSVQFRWEVFNVPNEAAFTGTSSNGGGNSWTLTSSTFGKFLSAADPRIMQFAMKYNF